MSDPAAASRRRPAASWSRPLDRRAAFLSSGNAAGRDACSRRPCSDRQRTRATPGWRHHEEDHGGTSGCRRRRHHGVRHRGGVRPGRASTCWSARSTTRPRRRPSTGSRRPSAGRCGPASSTRPTATPPSRGCRFTTELGDLADRDVVIEAVVEDEAEKLGDLPRARRGSSPRTCLLASNTSSIPIMKLAVGDRAPASGSSACTSSTRCRCCRSSRWCRACSPRPETVRARRGVRRGRSASTPCCARTGPASWSTRC